MSRSFTVTLDDRTFTRLTVDAAASKTDLRTVAAAILGDEARARDAGDAQRRLTEARAKEPAVVKSPSRATRFSHPRHWDAVDAAIERAGLPVDRSGR